MGTLKTKTSDAKGVAKKTPKASVKPAAKAPPKKRPSSALALAARQTRAASERKKAMDILAAYEAGTPVPVLAKRHKITTSAVYQRMCRARCLRDGKTMKLVAVGQPTLVARRAVAADYDGDSSQVAFLKGRLEQMEAMLRQLLSLLGPRKLNAAA